MELKELTDKTLKLAESQCESAQGDLISRQAAIDALWEALYKCIFRLDGPICPLK